MTKIDKDWFAVDAAYSNSKDLAKRTISDEILEDRAFEMDKNWWISKSISK